MDDQFINWDDLDLDSLLGEYTDDEEVEIECEFESESSGNYDDHGGNEIADPESETENKKPQKTKKAKTNDNIYSCPMCCKEYKTASGFRGHVSKKHNKPELKAHHHMKIHQEENHLPERKVPITTKEQIAEEMPLIITSSLQEIVDDKFHKLPSSVKGHAVRKIAAKLLAVNIGTLYAIFIAHMGAIFTSFGQTCNTTDLLVKLGKLRLSTAFNQEIRDCIQTLIDLKDVLHLKQFIQRLLTLVNTNYLKRQNELMVDIQVKDTALVTEKDREVIYYVCGFLVHSLRKKYYRLTHSNKKEQFLKCLDRLILTDLNDSLPSSWTDKMDRGGLKKTSKRFFLIFVQIERWIRDIMSSKSLNTNSLVNLRTTLLDYNLLRNSWQTMFPNTSTIEWTVLEHLIKLFLKVRGFAVTKLVRKGLHLEQKKKKAKAGSKRKALRTELKQKAMK